MRRRFSSSPIVWPVQKQLQSWMPKLVALAITVIATVAVCLGFASLAAWGFGRVGRSLVARLPRYQALYSAMVTWLDGHGVSVAGLWAEHFNVGWLLRTTQFVTGRVNTTLTFWVIALVYVMLGLARSRKHQAKGSSGWITARQRAYCSTAARRLRRNFENTCWCGRR